MVGGVLYDGFATLGIIRSSANSRAADRFADKVYCVALRLIIIESFNWIVDRGDKSTLIRNLLISESECDHQHTVSSPNKRSVLSSNMREQLSTKEAVSMVIPKSTGILIET